MLKKSPEKKAGSQSTLKRAAIFGALSLGLHAAPVAEPAYRLLAPELRDTATVEVRKIRAYFRSIAEEKEQIDISSIKSTAEWGISAEEYEQRRKAIEDLIIYHPDEAKKLVLDGTIPLDKIYINHGRFFIETEYQSGVSEKETEERRKALTDLKAEINLDLKNSMARSPEAELALIHKYITRYGRNNTWVTSYMGDLLTSEKHEGNCTARTKLILTILNDIHWKYVDQIKLNLMDIHMQVLFRMSAETLGNDTGKWYAASNFPYEIPAEDISETAVLDKNLFVKSHLGIESDARVLDENKNPARSRTLEDFITSTLIVGGLPLLLTQDLVGLRSPFNRKGAPKAKQSDPVTDAITVEVQEQIQNTPSDQSGSDPIKKQTKNKNSASYTLSRQEKIDARLTGEFYLNFAGSDPNFSYEIDLSQLERTELRSLQLQNGITVKDLTPIRQSSLRKIAISGSSLTDISPLVGMPLEEVDLAWTSVTNLSPLRGAPVRSIHLISSHIQDLSPLKGMPLEYVLLRLSAPDIDLSPLKDAPIKELNIGGSHFDLSPIKDTLLRLRDTFRLRTSPPDCYEINWETLKLEDKKDRKPENCDIGQYSAGE